MPDASAGWHPWWQRAVVYQIYPRSFADADGDGIGDLDGIARRLDYLAWLGVDVIWLSPVYPSPQADNGYDISDYQDVDPTFGTLEGFDRLLAAVHERGMKLVMDLVVNHTSDEHPWFVQSRSSRDNARRDWYWWRPARPGTTPGEPGAEPTNWESYFSGPTWSYDAPTGEYYLHLFSRRQPDLNWENPEVRQAVYAMMRWWLDRGVDGFRMDVINLISKDVTLPDGRLTPGSRFGDGHPYFVCGPRMDEFLQEMHAQVFADRPAELLTVGEMPGVTVEQARLVTDPARHELDMVFQFEHMGVDRAGPAGKWRPVPLDWRLLKRTFARWQDGLAQAGWNSLYWCNHDQPRPVSRFGDDGRYRVESATALATVLHLQRGTPYVYQGEELGMANAPFPGGLADFRDIESLNHYAQAVAGGQDPQAVLADLRVASRDNGRTPMQWDASPSAGFTTGTPWIGVNPDHVEVNVEAERADPGSVLHYYRRLIALRHEDRCVAHGDFHMLLPDDEQVFAFTRTLEAERERLLVLANVSSEPACAPDERIPDAAAWHAAERALGNYAAEPDGSGAGDADGSGFPLRPWEAVVLRRRELA